jgi:hypothetical protein
MQIIDELEVHKRGPYGGGIGHVSFTGKCSCWVMAHEQRCIGVHNQKHRMSKAAAQSAQSLSIALSTCLNHVWVRQRVTTQGLDLGMSCAMICIACLAGYIRLLVSSYCGPLEGLAKGA